LSDELAKVAVRANEAEERTAAAAQKARTDLEQEVSSARESAQAQAEKLRGTAAAFASDLACSAALEAEYAVLARMDAEQIKEQKTPSGATT
jgi:hypothetical protein